MTSALSVPLSFVAGNGEDYTNTVAVLSTLRKVSDRVDIFCQAGHIQAPRDASDLLAMLEPMIHQVSVKRGLFHPKIWVLEFENGTERRYRFLCSSRNLTTDVSWDLLVRLDGEPRAELANTGPDCGPLARFIEKLPELCTVKLDVDRLARIHGLASRLSKVRWELPEDIQELAFRPMGLGEEFEQGSIAGHLREPNKFRALNGKTGDAAFLGYEKLVVSPFLDESLLGRLRDPWMRNLHVYSRGDQLDLLHEKTVSERRSSFKSFDERGIPESASTGQAPSDPEGLRYLAEDLSGLHAKAYFCDYDHSTYALLGSANATGAGFSTNVEFLVELRGPKKRIGVRRIIDSLKEVPFEDYNGKGGQKPSEEDQAALSLENELRAAAAHQYLVEAQPDGRGTYIIELSHNWRPKAQFSATLRLLSLPPVTAAIVPLDGGPTHGFRSVPLADVTPYLLLTIKDAEAGLSKSTVIQGILLSELPDRLDEIVARQLNDPQKIWQFLLLFLTPEDVGIRGGTGANWLAGVSTARSASTSGLFEAMVGALASPDSGPVFADLQMVMNRLVALRSDDREMLELHSLWTAAVEALTLETRNDVCSEPALRGLRHFQRRTVDHVFHRFYVDNEPADRFLVADETGLGKSMVARGIIAKAIERLDRPDSDVDRIDIVYVCSNSDLAKQNLARLNVTGQKDIIESGRLTLLPTELGKLNAGPNPGTRKRVNFISLTPGTSFNVTNAAGQARERAVLFLILRQLGAFSNARHNDAIELLRSQSKAKNFNWEIRRLDALHPEGIVSSVVAKFHALATLSGNLNAFHRLMEEALTAGAPAVRPKTRTVVGGLRGDLAKAALECLEPDLIVSDEFQRFRDLLYKPEATYDDEDAAAELARQFLNYEGTKLLLLSATPYKAHTGTAEYDGDDHAADFRQLLRFLSNGRTNYIEALDAELDLRRSHLMKNVNDEGLTKRLESHLKLFMSRTERPQLGDDDMLSCIDMSPTDVRAADLLSYRSLANTFHAARSGNPLEYWKSVPMFAHFLTDYKVGRSLDDEGVKPTLPSLRTIDPEVHRKYGRIETDNAKFRAVSEHTVGRGWWKLLWIPPSLPYTKPDGAFAQVEGIMTKQLIFSAWNAAPTAITTLLSYEAEREIMSGSKLHGENTAEARKRFRGRLSYNVRNGEPMAMSTLALFVPHAALARCSDPLTSAAQRGSAVDSAVNRARAAECGKELIKGDVAEPALRLGAWASYFSIPGALPSSWGDSPKLARQELRRVDEEIRKAGKVSDEDGDEEGSSDAALYLTHTDRMVTVASQPSTGWEEGIEDLAANSPANCVFRALSRIVPENFDESQLWKAALRSAAGLRTLFNRLDVTELLDRLYPDGDYWQKVLRYCESGNLQAVLDEYVFQLRSQQAPGPVSVENLQAIADDIRLSPSLKPAQLLAKYPDKSHEDLRLGVRFAVRYSNARTDDGDSTRLPDVRRAFNSPFWPFVLASTSVGQEGIDFHWWAHSVCHWNVPSNPVDFEQREGRVHRYLGHAVRKNVALAYGQSALKPGVTDPWQTLFDVATSELSTGPEELRREFAPHWMHPGPHKIERRLLDHPLSRDVTKTQQVLDRLAKYRLTLGQARQDDLLGLIKNGTGIRPLNLRP
jgi:hypothetical protein